MPNDTSYNSSGEFGTPGVFTLVAEHNGIQCRCCKETVGYPAPLYEFRNGDWLCQPCAQVISVLFAAGESRSYSAFNYLAAPLPVKTGWDL